MPTTLRPPAPADAPRLGQILHDAFAGIAARHNFPKDIPSAELGAMFAAAMVTTPGVFGVVAEIDGQIVGSNFLDHRDPIAGVGPITVDPAVQAKGVGRQLMQAVLDAGRDAAGIRLVQDAFNTVSLPLYASLGFDVREPLALLAGKPKDKPAPAAEVRPMTAADLPACAALCEQIYGTSRANELSGALASPMTRPFVLLRNGRLAAYLTAPTFWILNHGVAHSEQDLTDLLLGVATTVSEPISLLLPIRQATLFRWALAQGLRVVKPMNLMAIGPYRDPTGAWFPSVVY
ncbi:MAG TPA: GNAT family N-acetyltransferase [Tepidisphaeraceae bacterium]|nr:GNAT family N-acetyltransferase [Tepidisphaeraceae bacterium]